MAPRNGWQTKMRQATGEVSERKVPGGVPTRLDMTPKTRGGDRYDTGVAVSLWGSPAKYRQTQCQREYRMTLCGSEVPQDRWRGRTAGSGMWTRTRESASWSPCGDSAIPYG